MGKIHGNSMKKREFHKDQVIPGITVSQKTRRMRTEKKDTGYGDR